MSTLNSLARLFLSHNQLEGDDDFYDALIGCTSLKGAVSLPLD